MPLPAPQRGMVISYAYLWHREDVVGLEEGRKDRPCVIVLSAERVDAASIVTVLPITHSPPRNEHFALEVPQAVKLHLGLDADRSWVMLDEGNRFLWPGFDLRPLPGTTDQFVYGFLPPRLFARLIDRFRAIWADGQGRAVSRD